jgi:hypothetical protein
MKTQKSFVFVGVVLAAVVLFAACTPEAEEPVNPLASWPSYDGTDVSTQGEATTFASGANTAINAVVEPAAATAANDAATNAFRESMGGGLSALPPLNGRLNMHLTGSQALNDDSRVTGTVVIDFNYDTVLEAITSANVSVGDGATNGTFGGYEVHGNFSWQLTQTTTLSEGVYSVTQKLIYTNTYTATKGGKGMKVSVSAQAEGTGTGASSEAAENAAEADRDDHIYASYGIYDNNNELKFTCEITPSTSEVL